MRNTYIFISLIIFTHLLHGQDTSAFPAPPVASNIENSTLMPGTSGIPFSNLILPLSVLLFGFAIIAIIFTVYAKVKEFSPDHAIRIVSISMLVIGILFVVSTSYMIDIAVKTELYAPAFGLLGTLAGYLLSRNNGNDNTNTTPNV
ncbi:MAG: hypothetical protein NW207_00295 [Cytophagales bacterium]|nr:hypothetical protein [Cytophagales bacterium]